MRSKLCLISFLIVYVIFLDFGFSLKVAFIYPKDEQRIKFIQKAANDAINNLQSSLIIEFDDVSQESSINKSYQIIFNYSEEEDQIDLLDQKSPSKIKVSTNAHSQSNLIGSNNIAISSLTNSLMNVVESLANHSNLQKVVIFYDSKLNYDLDNWFKLWKESFMQMNVAFDDKHLLESEKTIRKLKRSEYKNFIIIGSTKSINLFLNLINQHDMFNSPNQWFAFSKSIGKIKCTTCSHSEYQVVQPIASILHEYEDDKNDSKDISLANQVEYFFYYDLTRLMLKAFIYEENATNISSRTISDLLVKEDKLFDRYGKFGEFKFINYDKSITQTSNWRGFQQIQFEVVKQNQLFNKHTRKRLLVVENDEPNASIMKTLRLEDDDEDAEEGDGDGEDDDKMKIVTLIQPPFVMKRISNDSEKIEYYGFLIDILEIIKKEGNLPQYEIEEDESGLYGINTDDKGRDMTWNGISAVIEAGEASMGLVAMAISGARDEVMDFTDPIFDCVGLLGLMKKPPFQDHFFVYVTVLQSDVWLCIFGAYLLTSVVIAVFDYYSPYSSRYTDPSSNDQIFSAKESFWLCFLSLTPQGGGEGPKALSGRLVTATWWLFGFIVIASYTANLAAFLTVSRLDKNIATFDDLTKQYKVRYTPIEATSTLKYFELMALNEERYYEIWKDLSLNDSMSTEERAQLAVWEYPIGDKYTKVWAQMNEIEKPESFEEAVKRIRDSPNAKEGYALIAETPSIKWIEDQSCDLLSLGPEFAHHPLAFPVQKSDSFNLKSKINPVLKKIKEDGRLEELKVKYWVNNTHKRRCSDYRNLSDGIPLRNSGGTFVIIGTGFFATWLILHLENFVITYFQKLKNFKKKNSDEKISLLRRGWIKLVNWLER